MTNQKKSVEQTVTAIQELDLDPIKFKLMDKEEGYGWSQEQANYHAIEYKRFLTLLAKYPDELIAPSKAVDKFWHGHILDTMKYAQDCARVFGHFMHHFPYFGMRGTEDKANLDAAALNTRRLYEKEFKTQGAKDASFCGAAEAGFCGAAQASFCGATEASFCGAAQASSSDATEASFCGAAQASSSDATEASFCGAAQASFCGAAETSFCGAAQASFCGAAQASFCGAAEASFSGATDKMRLLDVHTRPSLPVA